jgi:hypothetical protein
MNAEPAPNLRAMVCNAFAERHGGNRHRFIFGEARGEPFVELAFRSGFRVLNDYSQWAERHPSLPIRPYVVGVSRQEALTKENQWLLRLFTYYPPRFHFTSYQRQILLLAREGYTDNEIAALVGARPEAIKKRWSGIYDRVHEIFPNLLPSNGPSKRGQEKRRALLAHLRDRPEELRPYVRPASNGARR